MKSYQELRGQTRAALEEVTGSIAEAYSALEDIRAAMVPIVRTSIIDKYGLRLGGSVAFDFSGKRVIGVLVDIEVDYVPPTASCATLLDNSCIRFAYVVSVPYARRALGARTLKLPNWKYTLTSVPS